MVSSSISAYGRLSIIFLRSKSDFSMTTNTQVNQSRSNTSLFSSFLLEHFAGNMTSINLLVYMFASMQESFLKTNNSRITFLNIQVSFCIDSISLIATIYPVHLSLAFTTVPYAPQPKVSMISYVLPLSSSQTDSVLLFPSDYVEFICSINLVQYLLLFCLNYINSLQNIIRIYKFLIILLISNKNKFVTKFI